MKIRLRVLGGKIGPDAETDIGASCYLLSITVGGKEYTFMIDCGMETSDDDQISWRPPVELFLLRECPKIDFLLKSHGHRDHVGAACLDEVVSRLTDTARVIATKTTAAFLPHVFTDQRKVSRRRGEVLPYNIMDIGKIQERIFPVAKPDIIELVPGKIWVLVWPSGHIRGACSFIFKIKDGRKEIIVMFSGDYSTHGQLTTAGAPLPPEGWRPHRLIIDCTNGAEPLNPWEHEIARMVNDHRTTVERGAHAFTFAFSMDRSQTFADRLASCGIPTWIDGPSAINYANIMLSPEGLWCDHDRPLDLGQVLIAEEFGEPLRSEEPPAAVIAPSGMGHGPAVRYLKELLPRENALVAASGYVAPGTNGWRVVHAKRGETVMLEDGDGDFIEIPVNAQCEQYRATAHSHREHAVQRIGELLKTSPEPTVVLTHGSRKSYDWFESSLVGLETYRIDRPKDRDIILAD